MLLCCSLRTATIDLLLYQQSISDIAERKVSVVLFSPMEGVRAGTGRITIGTEQTPRSWGALCVINTHIYPYMGNQLCDRSLALAFQHSLGSV